MTPGGKLLKIRQWRRTLNGGVVQVSATAALQPGLGLYQTLLRPW